MAPPTVSSVVTTAMETERQVSDSVEATRVCLATNDLVDAATRSQGGMRRMSTREVLALHAALRAYAENRS
jgi:hypothetical protein